MKAAFPRRQDIFSLAGWLFADLLLVLTIIFLVAAPPWQQLYVTPPPPPPPVICGVAQTPQTVYVRTDDRNGLLNVSGSGVNTFQQDLRRSALNKNKSSQAGLVEVFGGGTVGNGVQLARGAITSMQRMANSGFIFTSKTAYFRPLWNGTLPSDTLEVDVFYLVLAQSCNG